MKRFASLLAAAGALAAISAFALAGGASGAPSLPTLNIALNGVNGISVSGNPATGADNVVTTFTGTLPKGAHGATVGIVRLNPGVTPQQAIAAVASHHGNLDALTPFGALIVSAGAPGTLQTVLAPGGFTYYAVNISGNGPPAIAPINVAQSASPAALPTAGATQRAIEFGFRGPKVLHKGTIVRAENSGFLVHMIDLIGVKNKASGRAAMTLLRRGASRKAERPFLNGRFVTLLDPASPGALQQFVLNAKPGFYVEACFMQTQDGRDHTRLGMERLVQVKK
jgi:hypothetical protein